MIIGVTGKIASGKTLRMKEFEKDGFFCVYADDVVHELYKKGCRGQQFIELEFGDEYIGVDGDVDRIKLRNLVFSDPAELEKLNFLIHPLVHGAVGKLIKGRRGNIAIESRYFYPGCLKDYIDELIVVERNYEDILRTLVEDRGFSRDLAEQAIAL